MHRLRIFHGVVIIFHESATKGCINFGTEGKRRESERFMVDQRINKSMFVSIQDSVYGRTLKVVNPFRS